MPVSSSYHYPVMNRPTQPNKNLVTQSTTEIVSLISGSENLLLSSSNVSQWSQVAITLKTSAVLGTVAIEFSSDNSNWETWDDGLFSGLTAGALTSSQITQNSRNYVRVRSTDTTFASDVTASLNANNG